jgi:hypothetical protein
MDGLIENSFRSVAVQITLTYISFHHPAVIEK